MTGKKWNNGLLPGGRHPRLYLIRGDDFFKFRGENIPGVCAVDTAIYHKNGKWSSTMFSLTLAPGVRALELVSPLHGIWGEGFGSWAEAAKELALPVAQAQAVVRAEYAQTASRLDKREAWGEIISPGAEK